MFILDDPHVLVTDGVFSADGDDEVVFHPALDLDVPDFQAVQLAHLVTPPCIHKHCWVGICYICAVAASRYGWSACFVGTQRARVLKSVIIIVD